MGKEISTLKNNFEKTDMDLKRSLLGRLYGNSVVDCKQI